MISAHAFWAFPTLEAAPIGSGQHDSVVCGTLKSIIPHSPHSIQSSLKCTTKQKNLNHSLTCPHGSVSRPQTPTLLLSGSLCIQAFHRSTSPHNDLGWFPRCTAQLHLLQSRVFKRGLISPPLGRAEMWKTMWPSKIIHWLLPRGNLSQTLSNSFHKACNSLTLEFNSISGDFVQRQRHRLIGPQHYLWSMSPGDKDPTHCFSRCFLSPSGNPAERSIPKNVYYTITHKLYLAIAGFALKRKSMHNALQPTAVLSSSKADLEISCLHPSIAIFLVEAPLLQPGTTASRQLLSTLIKNRYITSLFAFRTLRYMKN